MHSEQHNMSTPKPSKQNWKESNEVIIKYLQALLREYFGRIKQVNENLKHYRSRFLQIQKLRETNLMRSSLFVWRLERFYNKIITLHL